MPLYRLSLYAYFVCWIVLAIFSYVYNSNVIYEPLLLFLTGISLYYSFFSVSNYQLPPYLKILFIFVGILVLYGIALMCIGHDVFWLATGNFLRKYLYILWLISALLSVVPVYVFTCEGLIGEKEMKIIFFFFLAACIYAFYGALKIQMLHAAYMKLDQEEYTITSVYSFLSIIPLIILFKKKQLLQFALLGIISIYLVLSAKRGAIILGGVSTLLVILSMLTHSSIKRKIAIVLSTILFMGGAYFFFNYQMQNSSYFAYRVDQTLDGYTSKRDEYARNVYDYYVNSTTTGEFFLGIGAQGTLSVNESFAHNDWLAILLEQGLFGALLYLLYWLGFIYTWIKSRSNHDSFVALGVLIFIGLGKTLFSMYYLPISPEMMTSSGFFAVTLGYYLGIAFPQRRTYLLACNQYENKI